ncbi:hypothetical protein SAMN03159423_4840 [Bradyrhizobium sp. NFR13]|uniref:hypothetical protein n=1 Tax=Bradyrhizobium sp. NFR13 TaxID=1566285 RepID=UPI0008F18B8A|nr:hypothetical protein [Bradyrhizobium sp. NFR13]SFM00260.1 hypothetical protein SAMN03159423_4840 [Bradyrhizobium sp. NFR13]
MTGQERADQRRKVCTEAMAKYFCRVVGIEPVDTGDDSANWWMFVNEAGEIYDGLLARFPATASNQSEDAT